jgi:hypothetical protein
VKPKQAPKKPAPRKPAPLTGNAARALAAYEAMQKYFYLKNSDLYAEALGEPQGSYLWPFSQALAATVSLAHVRTQQSKQSFILGSQLRGLQDYLAAAPPVATASSEELASIPHFAATVASVGVGATSFYDDNDWVALELVRVYELTHDKSALALAEQIMAFEEAGWVNDPEAPCLGGLPQDATEGGGYAITAAPAAELGAQLYHVTANAADLQFAQMAYSWVRQCLLLPSGLIADHIEANGEEVDEVWSYTQGAMIGAGTLLYQATGNPGYLDDAYAGAEAAMAYFSLEALVSEGEAAPAFASILVRNLLYLGYVMRSNLGHQLAQEYLNFAWETLHQPDGLYLTADGSATSLLGQAGIVQIYSLLSTSPATYF